MIIVSLTALLLVGNAYFVCFAESETVLTCVMEGMDENGYIGMRIDVSADPDVEAYDLDVLYDVRSVNFESVEERCGEPKAFEYKDFDRDGVLRVVGLVGEVVVGEKTLLYIRWKPVGEEDVNYVPTLAVRDLVDEAGEDLPYAIVYEDAGGVPVIPSPSKTAALPNEEEDEVSGASASYETEEETAGIVTGSETPQGAETGERDDADRPSQENIQAADTEVEQETAEESEPTGEISGSSEEKDGSRETGGVTGHNQVAGVHVSGSDGEFEAESVRDDGAGIDASEPVSESAEKEVSGAGIGTGRGDEVVGKKRCVGAVMPAGTAAGVGAAILLAACALYYYRKKNR